MKEDAEVSRHGMLVVISHWGPDKKKGWIFLKRKRWILDLNLQDRKKWREEAEEKRFGEKLINDIFFNESTINGWNLGVMKKKIIEYQPNHDDCKIKNVPGIPEITIVNKFFKVGQFYIK